MRRHCTKTCRAEQPFSLHSKVKGDGKEGKGPNGTRGAERPGARPRSPAPRLQGCLRDASSSFLIFWFSPRHLTKPARTWSNRSDTHFRCPLSVFLVPSSASSSPFVGSTPLTDALRGLLCARPLLADIPRPPPFPCAARRTRASQGRRERFKCPFFLLLLFQL